jgi:hypothetical protein
MQILQGPVGSGHNFKEIQYTAIPATEKPTGIWIAHGDYINGIGLVFPSGIEAIGGGNAAQDQFDLNAGEYITGFAGTYGDVINTVVIYTNQRCSPKYGSVDVSTNKPELVATILDNTTTQFFDTAPMVNFAPPSTEVTFPTQSNQWAARSNFPNSRVWVPGNQVRYAVSFVYPDGETTLGPWSSWQTIGAFAFPTLSNLPCSQDANVAGQNYPVCIGRKLYRNCQAPGPNGGTEIVEVQELVATINDNTGTTVLDAPPPPAEWTSTVKTPAGVIAKTAG